MVLDMQHICGRCFLRSDSDCRCRRDRDSVRQIEDIFWRELQ